MYIPIWAVGSEDSAPDAVKFIIFTSAEPGLIPGERSIVSGTTTSDVVFDLGPLD
jgi:hypothetical protein